MDVNKFIRANYKRHSNKQLARRLGMSIGSVEHRVRRMALKRPVPVYSLKDPKKEIEELSKIEKEHQKVQYAESKVKVLFQENTKLKSDLEAAFLIKHHTEVHDILPSPKHSGEATLVGVLSDTHFEEEVKSAAVNGLNRYNLEIARKRSDHFFATFLRLIEIEEEATTVTNLVLALLGDFITGNIHEEMVEITQLGPLPAAFFAQELLYSGIRHLLHNTQLPITIVCHSGNHARTTKEQRHATEHDYSLEWMVYKNLELIFRNEKQITFIIPESYHSYLKVYNMILRFHHGHAINYGGGIGGITIPVNKAIAQWNKSKRADIDVFGHFHTSFDGGNFIANGSMIGFNAYAVSIKASFEEPIQMMFGIHSKLGKYVTRPIKFL